ncbi:MAG: MarR family transcriptional regulator [Gemmatimonadaceae bacterium]|nr:MarR family transcriptional regulator [Gemmatimonadaceae bacterium]
MHARASTDVEMLVARAPAGHHAELRLWLRLLSCTTLITQAIRQRLRESFGVTLPQFDLMAQLAREPKGLRLGELSSRLMVTGGNVTGLVTRLETEGWVRRAAVAGDRRARVVRLTPRGARAFARMAAVHERWITELFGELPRREVERLTLELRALKDSVRRPRLVERGRG